MKLEEEAKREKADEKQAEHKTTGNRPIIMD